MASSRGKHRRAVVEPGWTTTLRAAPGPGVHPRGWFRTGSSGACSSGGAPCRGVRLLRRGLDVVVVDDVDRCLLRAGPGAVDADVLGDQVRVDVGADALVGCDQPPGPVGPDLR